MSDLRLSWRVQVGIAIFLSVLAYTSVVVEFPPLWLVPIGVGGMVLALWKPRLLVYAYYATLPIAIEFPISTSLATNLPSEPLMLILSGLIVVYAISQMSSIKKEVLVHPISMILLALGCWGLFTTLMGDYKVIGIKYSAAKAWYFLALYAVPSLWFDLSEIRKLVRVMIYASIPVLLIILYKHSLSGFDFSTANFVPSPFFRNHVVSAVFVLMLTPVAVLEWKEAEGGNKWFWVAVIALLVVSIYFSYTRAAQGTLVLLAVFYLVLRFRLTLIGFLLGLVLFTALVLTLVKDNKYLEYAPDYATTITHSSFEGILEATLQGKDISSMERVYRWVAAGYMVKDKPWLGYGPGSFYESYMPYTVLSFRTYVSDNPERSGLHNQFFLKLVEQGVIGLLLFLLLYIYAVWKAESLYHSVIDNGLRGMVAMAYMILMALVPILLINDLIETDKIGTFFFLSLAIIVMVDTRRVHIEPEGE